MDKENGMNEERKQKISGYKKNSGRNNDNRKRNNTYQNDRKD
jgi:hypothetical protein